VVDGKTGILVPRGDTNALYDATAVLIDNPDLRRRFGEAGRKRCVRDFSPEKIRQALVDEYRRLIKTNAGKDGL
jgi:glycosyltransferase involved in cell wall biosynthesis